MTKRKNNELTKIAAIAGLLILQGSITACRTHSHDAPPMQSPDLLNVTLKMQDLDDQPAELVNGIFEGDHLNLRVLLTDTADINGDGLMDGASIIFENSGGSGNFRILCLFMNDGEKLIHTDQVYIGDRIKVTNLSIAGESIRVDYLDRAAEDSFAIPPHIKKTVQYSIRKMKLKKLSTDLR